VDTRAGATIPELVGVDMGVDRGAGVNGATKVVLPSGAATAIGSLPHTDPRAAAAFVLEHLPHLPAVPSLPRRHPAETLLGQVTSGVRGMSLDDDGRLVLDIARVDPMAAVVPDLEHPAFGGLRAFCDVAQGHTGLVKWQMVGPVTLGGVLMRRGLPMRLAYDMAVRTVRLHLRAIYRYVDAHLPGCGQVVFLDEPSLAHLQDPSFPMPADAALDVVSGALAAVEPISPGGIHCCHIDADPATLLAAGPTILSVPAQPGLVRAAGYLARFLDNGGWIAWGVVPSDGPVASADHYWRELSALWCDLVRGGCDAGALRRQAFITPHCGLAAHDEESASRVLAVVAEIAGKVAGQAVATLLSLGA